MYVSLERTGKRSFSVSRPSTTLSRQAVNGFTGQDCLRAGFRAQIFFRSHGASCAVLRPAVHAEPEGSRRDVPGATLLAATAVVSRPLGSLTHAGTFPGPCCRSWMTPQAWVRTAAFCSSSSRSRRPSPSPSSQLRSQAAVAAQAAATPALLPSRGCASR